MKYIKLFESFTSLEDIKEQIKGSLYEIEDLGVEVYVISESFPTFKDASKVFEEIQINICHRPKPKIFTLTIEMIESIQSLLNWASKEHHFDNSMYILPSFDKHTGLTTRSIKIFLSELIGYKDIDIIGLELRLKRIV